MRVRARSVRATAAVIGTAAVAAAALAAADARLVLLPAAAVIGWLNLAGY